MRTLALWMAALLLAGCATGPSPGTAETPRIVRASIPGAVDYTDGVALFLTPPDRGALAQLRLVERAGYRTPLHVHHETDETFFVLQGELTLFVDGEVQILGPGDYAFVSRGTPHAQGNRTQDETILLLTMAPGDFAGFFEARAELVLETPPGHPRYGERMMALGQRFDIEVLGPAPF